MSWIKRYWMQATGPIPERKLTFTSTPRSANTQEIACAGALSSSFNLKRKPWIIPDEVDVETVVRVIDTCPSGALKYRQK